MCSRRSSVKFSDSVACSFASRLFSVCRFTGGSEHAVPNRPGAKGIEVQQTASEVEGIDFAGPISDQVIIEASAIRSPGLVGGIRDHDVDEPAAFDEFPVCMRCGYVVFCWYQRCAPC